jgi:hypothetical protein
MRSGGGAPSAREAEARLPLHELNAPPSRLSHRGGGLSHAPRSSALPAPPFDRSGLSARALWLLLAEAGGADALGGLTTREVRRPCPLRLRVCCFAANGRSPAAAVLPCRPRALSRARAHARQPRCATERPSRAFVGQRLPQVVARFVVPWTAATDSGGGGVSYAQRLRAREDGEQLVAPATLYVSHGALRRAAARPARGGGPPWNRVRTPPRLAADAHHRVCGGPFSSCRAA